MTLLDLFKAVKEENLTKTQLENFHTQLTSLYAQMHLEQSELEKAEAIYFLEKKTDNQSDISIKRMWKGTPNGLRQIDLTHYIKASEKVLTSLKSRLYSTY